MESKPRQKLRSCTSHAAFTVQVRLKKDEPDIGPDGLKTKIMDALGWGGKSSHVFDIAHFTRRGLITFIFYEHQRAEVVKRFREIGIKVPAHPPKESA